MQARLAGGNARPDDRQHRSRLPVRPPGGDGIGPQRLGSIEAAAILLLLPGGEARTASEVVSVVVGSGRRRRG